MRGFVSELYNPPFQYNIWTDENRPLNYKDDRYQIEFHGEIYNALELQEMLTRQGVSITTDLNSEIVVALYDLKKEKAVEELRGMFAFVIWDHMEQILFAARDPFGIKSFYYKETNEGLAFAFEKKSLLATESEKLLSREALQHYFSFQYVPEPYRLIENIHTLEPGHYLLKKRNEKVSIRKYNRLSFHPVSKPAAYYIEETRRVLRDSIEKHTRGDVPIGAFLSGGVDSASIVALAKQYHPNMKTFTVGFEREGFNEIDIAKDTADKLDVENIDKIITAEEYVRALPQVISYLDEPVADPAAVPLYFAAQEARKHVKVVLSGEGADELFGGYNIYREPQALKVFQYIPYFVKKWLYQLALLLPEGMKGKNYLLRGTIALNERYIGNAFLCNEKEKRSLLIDYQHNAPFTNVTKSLYDEAVSYDDTLKMQYIDLHTWLRGDILVKADRMTRAHSLQLRVPFLDQEVFEVARQIPTNLKITKGTTKYVLREAMKGIIPDAVLTRKKLGFPVPIRHWLRDELYDWAYDLIKNSSTEYLIDKHEAHKLLINHAIGKQDYSRKIWAILVFMLWHKLHIESESDKILRQNTMNTSHLG